MDALLNVPCGQGPHGDCGSDAMRPGWQLVRDGDASEDGPVLPGERHICYSSSLALEMETPAQTDASPQGALPRRGEREAEAKPGSAWGPDDTADPRDAGGAAASETGRLPINSKANIRLGTGLVESAAPGNPQDRHEARGEAGGAGLMPRVADITAELPQRDALVVRPTTAAPKVGAFFGFSGAGGAKRGRTPVLLTRPLADRQWSARNRSTDGRVLPGDYVSKQGVVKAPVVRKRPVSSPVRCCFCIGVPLLGPVYYTML